MSNFERKLLSLYLKSHEYDFEIKLSLRLNLRRKELQFHLTAPVQIAQLPQI